MSVFLLAYGAATLAGSVGGGLLADSTASRALIAGTAALCAALLTLFLVGTSAWLVVPVLVVWGLVAFDMTPRAAGCRDPLTEPNELDVAVVGRPLPGHGGVKR